eukprot:CAMPEP_0170541178 /NCGR_PEP_ID=MMETSP0211-20121228/979_1 /TAXON_ID=311385 /ORGANISM="Pseudokeronopsis sp., Strain OXSARD2" /LENGTH=112 /DNA_ID=CAMNT_0010843807 /DNA_START=20 /DNA_END=355 /DNA_ORIENTATION=+
MDASKAQFHDIEAIVYDSVLKAEEGLNKKDLFLLEIYRYLILNHEAELPKQDPLLNFLQFNKTLFDLILKEKVFFNFEFSTFSSTLQEKGYSWTSMVAEKFPAYKFNIQDYI